MNGATWDWTLGEFKMFDSGGHAGPLHKLMLYEISVKIISLFITIWYTLHVVFRQKPQELDTKQVPSQRGYRTTLFYKWNRNSDFWE